jgi:hypothetical protein
LARRRVEEAKQAVETAKQKLGEYRIWRPGEEKRLFETVRGTLMPQTGLDAHRNDIQALRVEELHLEECVREAESAVAAAEKAAEQAGQAHADAVRDRRKIEEHKEIWLRAEQKRQELAEEAELEDFERFKE